MTTAAAVFGIVGAIAAVLALLYAHAANRKSYDANVLAHDALELGRKSEERAVERDDVRWDGDWSTKPEELGVYLLRNIGTTNAYSVLAIVEIDGDRQLAKASAVDAGRGYMRFDFPSVRAALRSELEKYVLQKDAMYPIPDMGRLLHRFETTVRWKTVNGTEKSIEEKVRGALASIFHVAG